MAYYSRKFSGAEMSYPIHGREQMVIVMSFQHWRRYLEGATETEVFSNQENLERFMSQTSINGRQARWLLQPAPYDFRILLSKRAILQAHPLNGYSRIPSYLCTPPHGPIILKSYPLHLIY